jgi:hypothetical protein
MLRAIFRALCSYDNGATTEDIVYHVRGQYVRTVDSDQIVKQLITLQEKGVLMHHGSRWMLIDTVA